MDAFYFSPTFWDFKEKCAAAFSTRRTNVSLPISCRHQNACFKVTEGRTLFASLRRSKSKYSVASFTNLLS
jgi:hypothetical protein